MRSTKKTKWHSMPKEQIKVINMLTKRKKKVAKKKEKILLILSTIFSTRQCGKGYVVRGTEVIRSAVRQWD